MKIVDFKDDHLEEASKLFQKNYTELLEKFPFLPGHFNRIETISSNLKKITANNPSLVALQSNQVVGYMTGYSQIKELKGSFSGTYMPEWAHASIRDGREKIYENLYRSISAIWASRKDYTHIISFLENSNLSHTFQMLGFGMQVIDAAMPLEMNAARESSSFKIESAAREHISQLKQFNLKMNEHLQAAPVFIKWDMGSNSEEEIIKDFLSDDQITLVASINDEIIACIRGVMNEGNIDILNQQGTFGINFGYTDPDFRKTGIASVLLNEILQLAKAGGCRFASVDFETQNIEGRNFWLKYFKPVIYSMLRKIDDRVQG